MYIIYSNEAEFKDAKKAYTNLIKAIHRGVSCFNELSVLFKENVDELAALFVASRPPSALIDKDNKQELLNLHDAWVKELQTQFMSALGKDRLYKRPAGFVQDSQIWLIGVLAKYFIFTVLRFDHADFLKAMKLDLGPILGDTGVWSLTNYLTK